MYKVRTDDGLFLAEVDNEVALKMIQNSKGHFRSYRSVNSLKTKTVWQFDEDYSFGTEKLRIMLYKNYLLISN